MSWHRSLGCQTGASLPVLGQGWALVGEKRCVVSFRCSSTSLFPRKAFLGGHIQGGPPAAVCVFLLLEIWGHSLPSLLSLRGLVLPGWTKGSTHCTRSIWDGWHLSPNKSNWVGHHLKSQCAALQPSSPCTEKGRRC